MLQRLVCRFAAAAAKGRPLRTMPPAAAAAAAPLAGRRPDRRCITAAACRNGTPRAPAIRGSSPRGSSDDMYEQPALYDEVRNPCSGAAAPGALRPAAAA
jgi:hypothetical protein